MDGHSSTDCALSGMSSLSFSNSDSSDKESILDNVAEEKPTQQQDPKSRQVSPAKSFFRLFGVDVEISNNNDDSNPQKTAETNYELNEKKKPPALVRHESRYEVITIRKRKRTTYFKEPGSPEPKRLSGEETRRRLGVFLSMKLEDGGDSCWKIKKKLTKSDVNDLCRLLLPTSLVENHIFPLMEDKQIENIKNGDNGEKLVVFDADTNSEHEMVLKRWKTTNSIVLMNNWKREFVSRRKLVLDDFIGLFYHPPTSTIYFSLLNKAPL